MGESGVQSVKDHYPWVGARLPEMSDDWRQALDDALDRLAALPLPPTFRLTDVHEKYNSLRIDWKGAGNLEPEIQAVANELEDRTQGELPRG